MKHWTDDCTSLLEWMAKGGHTDQEIADSIEARLGMRFHRNTVLAHRRARQLDACWSGWSRRPRVHVRHLAQAS